jgi:hypothetical protein
MILWKIRSERAFSGLAHYFHNVAYMIREVIDMISFRSLAEEAINCWLSYAMSMPVSFNLSVIFLFLIQYLGFKQIQDFWAYRGMPLTTHTESLHVDFTDPRETL